MGNGAGAAGPVYLVNEEKIWIWERGMEGGIIGSYRREKQLWNSPLRAMVLNIGYTLESQGEL